VKYVSLASSQKAKEILESLKIRTPSEIHIRDIAMERGAYVRERMKLGVRSQHLTKKLNSQVFGAIIYFWGVVYGVRQGQS